MKTFISILLLSGILVCQDYRGVDISTLEEMEYLGVIYSENGQPKDAVDIFADSGVNYVRLKLWHTPESGYNDLESVIKLAKRVKERGCKILLNFHYSDTWADPSHQDIPAAWSEAYFQLLRDSVYNYTSNVIASMKANGVMPDMVQIGNEISCGFLWYEGNVCNEYNTHQQWNKFTYLLSDGINAVKANLEDGEECKIMIHTDRGGDLAGAQYFCDKLDYYHVEYDVIGLSYYPWWHGGMANLEDNLVNLINRFNKEIVVVETGYPWTLNNGDSGNNFVWSSDQLPDDEFLPTPSGQKKYMDSLFSLVRRPDMEKVTGIFYWAPDLTIANGFYGVYENIATFNYVGNALPVLQSFADPATSVKSETEKPVGFSLAQNYPNPFNPSTIITYSLADAANIKIVITNILGERVETLLDEYKPAGTHEVRFDATNLTSGVYFYQLASGGNIEVKKMVVSK